MIRASTRSPTPATTRTPRMGVNAKRSRLKIAVIGSRGLSTNYSGVEVGVREVCPRLANLGHEVFVYAETHPVDETAYWQVPRLTEVKIPAVNGKHTETITRSALATWHAKGLGVDVINYRAQGSGIFTPVTRALQTPSVVTVDGLDWVRDKWSPIAKRCLRLAELTATRFADKVVVVSKSLQQYYETTYGSPVTYIPHAYPTAVVGAEMPRPSSLPDGIEVNEFVLFASRLVPEKGIGELIAAYNTIDTEKILIVAGGNRYQDSYEQALRAAANPNKIQFVGHVSGPALRALFVYAYLFVLPSHIEGRSIALLEAMDFGTCPLVSDIPANLEVIKGCGMSFPVGNETALRNELSRLISYPDSVQAIKAKLRNCPAQNYTWDDVADAYDSTFKEVIARTRGHRDPS